MNGDGHVPGTSFSIMMKRKQLVVPHSCSQGSKTNNKQKTNKQTKKQTKQEHNRPGNKLEN